jgi:clan AA aspartic protease
VIGIVDDQARALIEIPISCSPDGKYVQVSTWIDTAFDGHLVFSSELISQLRLESLAKAEAILADGSKVTLETHLGYIEWFGTKMPLQVVANEGQFPLLGTGLLQQRVLHIDYSMKRVQLD